MKKDKGICEWCMEKPVSNRRGPCKFCDDCAHIPDDHPQLLDQYKAFTDLFRLHMKINHDPNRAFLCAIVATSNENYDRAVSRHKKEFDQWKQLRKESA
jgi:hypothetical protein